MTRARKHVAIICDSSTVSNNKFLLRFLQHIREKGLVRHMDIKTTSGNMPSTTITRGNTIDGDGNGNGNVSANKDEKMQRSRN